ncbi:MAG: hypothetical protein LAO55_13245 [Acidobacteriia bacterium]|nr:hypothetical protein [Terriglobia bacterium]
MKPDFSGEWILDRQASTLSPAAAAFDSGVMRIDHREPVFAFQIKMVAGGKSVEHAGEGRVSDGREVAGEGIVTSLCWDGDALVFTFREPQWTMSFRYELLEKGRRLRAVEQLRGAGRDQDNVWVYDRR